MSPLPANRGRTTRGRARANAARVWEQARAAPPLLRTTDHGEPVLIKREIVAPEIRDDRWIEPFVAANEDTMLRLGLSQDVRSDAHGLQFRLVPGSRLGALPLRSATTRRVVAGLLVEPRFDWASVGRVLAHVRFRVEPDVGGAALVPGSAREVPPWILAGPVLARLSALLRHLARRFEMVTEQRDRPRGGVDWNDYARHSIPQGSWQRFRCTFPDLRDDGHLISAMRWTTARLRQDLERASDTPIGRVLLDEALTILHRLGPGSHERPQPGLFLAGDALRSTWLQAGWEAMAWVSEERGLGGERNLDGLPWTLASETLWEAWVETILDDVALRLGARVAAGRRGNTVRAFAWSRPPRTIGHLAPDFVIELPGHTVFVDAKYKPHLEDAARIGWDRVATAARDAHRADVHQALAYASLSDQPRVDTVLAYPVPYGADLPFTTAELPAGNRLVRLMLLGLPFGFEGPGQRDRTLGAVENALRVA